MRIHHHVPGWLFLTSLITLLALDIGKLLRSSEVVTIGKLLTVLGLPFVLGGSLLVYWILRAKSQRVAQPDSGGDIGSVPAAPEPSEPTNQESRIHGQDAFFEDLVGKISDLIIEVGKESTIRYVSPSVETILGFSTEGLIGSLVTDLVHPEDRGNVRAALSAAWSSDTVPDPIEFRALHQTDSSPFCEAVARVHEHPSPGIVLTIRDVTARQEAQDALLEREVQLRKAQKMEAIARLAGGVAHDFNNLLTAILGNCDLIQEDLSGNGREIRVSLNEIRQAAEQAAYVTSQLLAFSRQQLRTPENLLLGDAINESLVVLRGLLREDILLDVSISQVPAHVLADPGQFEEILVNLGINAADAMPHGGTLAITTDVLSVEEPFQDSGFSIAPGTYYQIMVTDTGAGMPPDELDRVFEPFFTTKATGEGIGLGLSTVYGIVKQSGGYIGADSVPGQGTTFRLYLPVVGTEAVLRTQSQPEATGDTPSQEETSESQPEIVILVVEDEDSVRKFVFRILGRAGYTVLRASNGLRALEVLEELGDKRPDLVITDVVMPELGGPALAERIRQAHPGLPVLFMSGYADRTLTHRGTLDPEIDFLPKPFTSHQLLNRVQELLEGGVSPLATPDRLR